MMVYSAQEMTAREHEQLARADAAARETARSRRAKPRSHTPSSAISDTQPAPRAQTLLEHHGGDRDGDGGVERDDQRRAAGRQPLSAPMKNRL